MRTKFKFSHRGTNGWGMDRYYWVATRPIPGDSRTEHVSVAVDWFWNPGILLKAAQEGPLGGHSG